MASVAILVGGRATRFGGRDKSALMVGGQSILERQIAELSRLTEDLLIVTGHDDIRTPLARERPLSVRVVTDRVRDSGPLGGLDAALAAARDDVLMLVAGDMPFVTAELAGYLLTLAPQADAVVPRTERGYHPLCAAYTRACVPAIAARLRERRLKMLDLLEDVRVRVVTPAELDALGDRQRLLANVNTPAEYEEIDALFGHEL
jgi:molybdopterin-guanine dinucleotide biosynthesis protein A